MARTRHKKGEGISNVWAQGLEMVLGEFGSIKGPLERFDVQVFLRGYGNWIISMLQESSAPFLDILSHCHKWPIYPSQPQPLQINRFETLLKPTVLASPRNIRKD